MRSKMVKIIDVYGNVYEYNGVKRAFEECPLPVWYGIYPHRQISKRYAEEFKKIESVQVDDVVRYRKSSIE